ncbi:SDR family NAD(P)-dependent oxidoreductase [Pelagibacterium sediminicola]|uniref:SDR family NAD(P)-dependent oxidoreductase n=1 Tax=Pelagibacterium sediminicola TaxID=2248761 RepID=UPI000E31201F|nr:SDR family NAD(P)-dependent oxidoreductase [Pelagibacterium sediminicola]
MQQDDMALSGKTALVMGASRGIGRSIAIGLAEAGAKVAGFARTTQALGAVGKDIAALGGGFLPLCGDATDSSSVSAGVEAADRALGGIDVLVNCVGGALARAIADMSDEDWHSALDLNLSSVFYACRAVAPVMKRKGRGSIVNIASSAALRGRPGLSSYSASKAAVINLTKAMALEWAGDGIRANAICPGRFLTDATAGRMNDPEQYRDFIKLVPLGRIGQPDELKSIAVWLASDASAFATGMELVIDGGQTLR